MTTPMLFTMMDLIDGMRAFVATVETGSFTAAANRVGISKKLVSKYVAQLEARLGVRLLHRTTRTLNLSEAGQRYFARCADLIEELDALEDTVRIRDTGLYGTLRIGAPSSFGETHVLPLIQQFQREHPDLIIDLRLSDRYINLADAGIDLTIRIGELEDSSLISRRLSVIELWAVASPTFLEEHGEPETPKDLLNFDCIRDTNLRAGPSWPFVIDGRAQRISINGSFLVNSYVAVRELTISGAGIALCPDCVVSGDVMTGQLKRVLSGFRSSTLGINAVFLSARHMPKRTRVFLEYLVERFRDNEKWHNIRAFDQVPGPGM